MVKSINPKPAVRETGALPGEDSSPTGACSQTSTDQHNPPPSTFVNTTKRAAANITCNRPASDNGHKAFPTSADATSADLASASLAHVMVTTAKQGLVNGTNARHATISTASSRPVSATTTATVANPGYNKISIANPAPATAASNCLASDNHTTTNDPSIDDEIDTTKRRASEAHPPRTQPTVKKTKKSDDRPDATTLAVSENSPVPIAALTHAPRQSSTVRNPLPIVPTSTASSNHVAAALDVPLSSATALVCIADLHPSTTVPWVTFGRVLCRTNPKDWNSLGRTGRLFSAHIVDAQGNMIKATVFGDGVGKFFDVLAPGNVCRITGGKIKRASPTFSLDPFELTFDDTSDITTADDAIVPVATLTLTSTAIDALRDLPAQAKVNIFGIVHDHTGVRDVWSVSGKTSTKRELLIVDTTMAKVICTLWGFRATEDIAQHRGKPVLIKGGSVSVYNNSVSINIGAGSELLFEPICPEAKHLGSWYAQISATTPFTGI